MDHLNFLTVISDLKFYDKRYNSRFSFTLKLSNKYLDCLREIGNDLIDTIYKDFGESYLFKNNSHIIFFYNKTRNLEPKFSQDLFGTLKKIFYALDTLQIPVDDTYCSIQNTFSSLEDLYMQETYLEIIRKSSKGKSYVDISINFSKSISIRHISTLIDSGADTITLPGKSFSELCPTFRIYESESTFKDYIQKYAEDLEGKDSKLAESCKRYFNNPGEFLASSTYQERKNLISKLNLECLGGFSESMVTSGHNIIIPELQICNTVTGTSVIFKNIRVYIIPGSSKSIIGMEILSRFATTINTRSNWICLKPHRPWDEVTNDSYILDLYSQLESNSSTDNDNIKSFPGANELIPLLSDPSNLEEYLGYHNLSNNEDESDFY